MLAERGEQAQTPETPVAIKPFSKEALDFLKRKGHLYYPLDGQSLKDQMLAGRHFWHIAPVGENFLTLSSMRSEVAFHPSPDKFFLPKSNNLILLDQQYMISEYSHKLQTEFGSGEIKAVMGDAPDFTLLAFLHLQAIRRKEGLFGRMYRYNYARTKTSTNGSSVADVGNFHATSGLHVDHWHADRGHYHVYAAPLIVPA